MKRKKPIKFNYSFSSEDVIAIIAALPLVPAFGAETEIQQSINESLCFSTMNKLANRNTDLIPNEVRMIALSIELAVEFLAGRMKFDVDQEIVAEIRPHIFTYNHLHEAFAPLLDQLDAQLDNRS